MKQLVLAVRLVGCLLSSMTDLELCELEHSDLYRRSPVLNCVRNAVSKNMLMEKSIVMELYKIPEEHISKSGFFTLYHRTFVYVSYSETV